MKKQEKDCVILVVEDEVPLAKAIQVKLEKIGFGVVTARNVEQAINFMSDIPTIDFIWLDHYLLGNKTGLEFVKYIKDNPKWSKIPIFLVTNTATKQKIYTYLSLGVNKYFIKAGSRLDEVVNEIKKTICKP